jgi:GH35 family endo-1,4-beta-xylanase
MNKKLIIFAFGTIMVASCADKFDTADYEVTRPENVEKYAYLNDYKPLKEYVTNPNFHLGVGTEVQEYSKQEMVYGLVNTNFTEVVDGNAMKMASCVDDKGNMDFGNVQQFINTATEAGLAVYGHTLAWHAQQPVKYLSSLLKDKELDVDPDALIENEVYMQDWTTAGSYGMWGQFPEAITTGPTVDGDGLTMATTGSISNFWELQYMVADGLSVEAGKEYVLRVELKGSPASENLHYVIGAWGNDIKTGMLDFTEEWETRDIPFTASDNVSGVHVLFQSGDYAGTYTVAKVQLLSMEKPALEVEQEVYYQDWTTAGSYSMWGQFPEAITTGPQVDGDGLTMATTGSISNFWELQYMVADGFSVKGGTKYVMHLTLKGSPASENLHYVIGAWGNDIKTGVLDFNSEWATKDIIFTASDDASGVHMLLQSGDYAGTYQVKDVTLCEYVSMNSIPLTDEEKKDTLTWAMGQWVKGMMEACEGNVKAWDVANETVGGYDADGDGFYELQHGSEGSTDFFWQDYLGDEDYVPTVVRFAREFGPENLKLFVNDYNLEYDWDASGNKKLESLIHWIGIWESKGVKIDGIGSQMHISYYMNPQEQQKRQTLLENSFKLMAATGKLVRISELDMGLVDENGKDVNTSDVTEEQHKAMAEYYKWVVSKYLEIIPQAQQWGICQWCITDSPANSGWRANQPVGLWDLNYNRKHTYAGFADGLSGK